ncbi:MAG TPA: DUF3450 family protein [Planctomycetota bacterium]|nr:DUF3450 family protein [Planctomycetota bacterium]
MNAHSHARGAAFGVCLFLAFPIWADGERPSPSVQAQEEAKLADELQGLVRKLREKRTGFYGRHRTRSEQLDSFRNSAKRLDTELAELRGRETEADRNLAEVRADLEKLRGEEAADRLRASLGPELEKSIREGHDFIERGIPYRVQDRAQRLGAPGDGSLSDKLSRYWSFLQEEIRVARSGEALSADIPLGGGRAKPARIFRVGHLVMGYVTEDGLEAGLWNGSQWVPAADPSQEKTIREAVDILDRRRAPALLALPVLRRGTP